jgi:hypothetical protein
VRYLLASEPSFRYWTHLTSLHLPTGI